VIAEIVSGPISFIEDNPIAFIFTASSHVPVGNRTWSSDRCFYLESTHER
jgi:hypothetical protein